MSQLYNTAFNGSNYWEFSSDQFDKFSKTWNVNLMILFNLPFDAHCWVVEELSADNLQQVPQVSICPEEEQEKLHQNSELFTIVGKLILKC